MTQSQPIKETNVWSGLISDCIKDMIELAARGNFTAKQELNGVTILVNGDSDAALIIRDQGRAQCGYITGSVGPYPAAVLSPEEIASDNQIKTEKKTKARHAEAIRLQQKQDQRFAMDTKLALAGEIELADEKGWREGLANNSDDYGKGVFDYAERWARLMQLAMIEGRTLRDAAESTSHEADIDGITGFMYGAAASILSQCWKHGEELRRWHNLSIQINDEGEKANDSGGVLNPALLSIG
jgi:hypothetical protein